MGLYDRDYAQEKYRSYYRPGPPMRFGFAPITPIVKKLLLINIVIFFAAIVLLPQNIPIQIGTRTIFVDLLVKWFSVFPNSFVSMLQIWRLITYQFLHGGIFHILFNMLGLFFLGPTLERHWGSKKFLIFYLVCGAVGGLFYVFLVATRFLPAIPMIGASGSILGMLAACAILFPQFVVFIFLFPVPIRVAAIILILLYVANLLTGGENAGGDASHLAGMAAGAIYVFSQSRRTEFRLKVQSALLERKIAARRNLQSELDRILQKVHDSGIRSLTQKEKKLLKKASEAEQMRNKL